MNASGLALAFALTASLGLAARAQGDQADVISQHGDALSRSTSAEALVKPMPAAPPNTAAPAIPSSEPVSGSPGVASTTAVPPSTLDSGKGRAVLIAVGALLALAMFLWERRRKD